MQLTYLTTLLGIQDVRVELVEQEQRKERRAVIVPLERTGPGGLHLRWVRPTQGYD